MELSFFYSFLKQIQKHQRKSYYSSQSVIQSSIGLIFRYSTQNQSTSFQQFMQKSLPIINLQILMVQRAYYERDPNSYNIVFPGGQADPGETDLQACERELFQEIGINTKECLYGGQFPSNFYYSKKRGKLLYISCHVWLLHSSSLFSPKLNPEQLIDFRWVPIAEILAPQSLTTYCQTEMNIFKRMGWEKVIADRIKGYFIQASLPAIDVKMERPLWGVTLWIFVYFLQMTYFSLPNGQNQKLKENIQNINKRMGKIELRFKENFILSRPINFILNYWNYHNRIKPFSYPPIQQKKTINYIWFLLLILLFVITYVMIM